VCLTSFVCVTWPIFICDVMLTRWGVCTQVSYCVSWLIYSHAWHDSIICVPCLIRMRDMTHLYVWRDVYKMDYALRFHIVWHDSFMCVTWINYMCDVTRLCVWYDSFICVTWLIHTFDKTSSCVCHDSLMRVTCLIHMCDMSHSKF